MKDLNTILNCYRQGIRTPDTQVERTVARVCYSSSASTATRHRADTFVIAWLVR